MNYFKMLALGFSIVAGSSLIGTSQASACSDKAEQADKKAKQVAVVKLPIQTAQPRLTTAR